MISITDKLIELGIEPLEGEAFTPFSEEEVATIETTIGALLPQNYSDHRLGGNEKKTKEGSGDPRDQVDSAQIVSRKALRVILEPTEGRHHDRAQWCIELLHR